jgi:hypothetical protein
MNIPNFHDGHFDGLRIGPNKELRLFLRTQEGNSFTLALRGVDALALSEVKQGNIVFDLVLRSGMQLTISDIEELFGVEADTPQAADLLKAKRGKEIQLLELSASYGAHGLVLFQSVEILPAAPG